MKTVPSEITVMLLKIQAAHVAKSYQRQVIEQMYSYYDEDQKFTLLNLM